MARPSSSGLCQPAISTAKATGAYGLILFIDEFQELAGRRQPFGEPDARGGWHALKPIDEANWLCWLAARFETVGFALDQSFEEVAKRKLGPCGQACGCAGR